MADEAYVEWAAAMEEQTRVHLIEKNTLHAELTRALDAASEARAEAVRLRGLCGKIRCVVGKEGTEDSILEAVQALRAELRAAVDALRKLMHESRGWVALAEDNRDIRAEFGNTNIAVMRYWIANAATTVAAYDANHPEVKP